MAVKDNLGSDPFSHITIHHTHAKVKKYDRNIKVYKYLVFWKINKSQFG